MILAEFVKQRVYETVQMPCFCWEKHSVGDYLDDFNYHLRVIPRSYIQTEIDDLSFRKVVRSCLRSYLRGHSASLRVGIPVFCLRASFRLTHLRVLLTRTFLWPPPFLPHEGRFIIAWLTCKSTKPIPTKMNHLHQWLKYPCKSKSQATESFPFGSPHQRLHLKVANRSGWEKHTFVDNIWQLKIGNIAQLKVWSRSKNASLKAPSTNYQWFGWLVCQTKGSWYIHPLVAYNDHLIKVCDVGCLALFM